VIAALFTQTLYTASVKAESTARPNIVLILADDQGWGDLSLHGNPNLSTPNIDQLARDGAQVKHFYVCAVCSPTRAEFLTGRYHRRIGVYSTSTGGERFDLDEETIADVFHKAGYATAAYGKWHSGMQYPYHPNARGFQDFYGFCSGHWGNYFSPMLEHNGRIVEGEGFLVNDLTDHAIQFIDRAQEQNQPFFVYLPFNTPHSPMQVPDEQWSRFEGKAIEPDPRPENARREDQPHTRAALAMCENIDANVGRLMSHLEEHELADDTIVVYFCDNGPNGWRWNGGLRGRKGSTSEGGLRSPCLIRYPHAVRKGTKVTSVAAAIDLLPTLADLAAIEFDPKHPLDGRSFARALKGEASISRQERLVFSSWRNKFSVRSAQFRKHLGGPLYDIQNDPREQIDVRQQHPEVAAELEAKLRAWIEQTESTATADSRPFPLGHPAATYTQLPARDAVPNGNIQRSNRFPNCTYMTHWSRTEDAITWDVDVLASGQFEVAMYYACDEKDVGSEIELFLGDQSIRTVIDEPNEVPKKGMEHDRVPRMEGYVKDWKPMRLGVIDLQPGRETLRLKANRVPGDEVAEMRLLMFRRLK